MATDNYLEKYLPMRIQIMISQSIKSFIDLVPNKMHLNQPDRCLLPKATDIKQIYEEYEIALFKLMHDIVINDNGFPDLKKRGIFSIGCS